VILGILADTGQQGVDVLRNWVSGLSLPRGVLRAYDDIGDEINVNSLLDSPVYIKYNSTAAGDAYMKSNAVDDFVGVIFQPNLFENSTTAAEEHGMSFLQFGNLPLQLF